VSDDVIDQVLELKQIMGNLLITLIEENGTFELETAKASLTRMS